MESSSAPVLVECSRERHDMLPRAVWGKLQRKDKGWKAVALLCSWSAAERGTICYRERFGESCSGRTRDGKQ